MIVKDIVDTQHDGCLRKYFNISIPKDHPLFDSHSSGGGEVPFLRTHYNQHTGYNRSTPRQQVGINFNRNIY